MKTLTKELQDAIAKIAQKVELTDVRTVELSARLVGKPVARKQAHLEIEARTSPGPVDDGFVVEGNFTLRVRPKKEGEEPGPPYLEVTYRAGAIYRWPGDLPRSEHLLAFAETNGLHHLWPYFRAFVQEACGRLSLAPVIIPTFRAIKYQPPSATEPAEKEK